MNKEIREIAYSIGILLTIPLLMIINTVVMARSFSTQALDVELKRKADVVNSVIAQYSLPDIESSRYADLQQTLNDLESTNPVIMHSSVVVLEDNVLNQVARSSSAPDKLTLNAKTQAKLAMDRNTAFSALINTTDRKGNAAQAWSVTTPVVTAKGKTIAAVSTSVLTTDAQEAASAVLKKSTLILAISIVLILGLLFRHFRLVGYVKLLAREKELNQTMSDFLSVATHELKAPTSIIKGYLSNVMDGTFGAITPEVNQQLEVAMAKTERLNSLVKDLLNVSRVDQGRVEYKFGAVDSAKILRVITDNYSRIATEKSLQLIYEQAESVPAIHADEGRVQEVFTNLIDNAIKYTTSGSVTVTQQVKPNVIITSIRDTGLGISPMAMQRRFQRFYRVQTPETQNISGTGLGLWIIKQYIEAMGGTIEVESMENVGSNFIVTLPVYASNRS